MYEVVVTIKKLLSGVKTPAYAKDGDGCFDIFAIEDGWVIWGWPRIFKTGHKFELPKEHVMKVYSRSGQGFKHNASLSNGTGIIDSGYRGELMVKLKVSSIWTPLYRFKKGTAIAQAIVLPFPKVVFKETDGELSATERGEGGLGHTTAVAKG